MFFWLLVIMQNKYSLNSSSYNISKVEWNSIKKEVIANQIKSDEAIIKYDFEREDKLCSKRVWFLYDVLLQEKYNHLYKREKLVNPKVGDFVYCDYVGFGRGVVKSFSLDKTIMVVKFDKRTLTTFCDTKSMTTNYDETKRKITRL